MKKAVKFLCILAVFAALCAVLTACNNNSHVHNYGEWEITLEAACETAGVRSKVCKKCGEKVVENIPALGHSYGKGIVIEEATCDKEGSKILFCSVCGYSDTVIIPTLAHNFVDKVCTECGRKEMSSGLKYTLSQDGTYYILNGIGTCADANIVIHDKYNGLSVKEIAASAFKNCGDITSVTISENITDIGASAFSGCDSLTSVYYIGSLSAWCDIKFGNAESNPLYYAHGLYIEDKPVAAISIPNAVTSIGKYQFVGWNGTALTVHGKVKSIGEGAFSGCGKLTDVIIPDGVESIGRYAFYDCGGIKSLTVGIGVASIGSSAFSKCTDLREINYNAAACKDLDGGYYNESWHYNYVFSEAGQKGAGIAVNIGGNVTKIPAYLFYPYSGHNSSSFSPKITSVTMGKKVASVGAYAFSGCNSLISVHYGGTVGDWCDIEFGNYDSNPLNYAHNLYIYNKLVTEIEIPDRVTNIGTAQFAGWNGIKLILPDNMTGIGEYAFYGCYRLIEVCNKSSLNIEKGSEGNGYVGYYAKNIYTPDTGSSKLTVEDGYTIYTDKDSRILMGYSGKSTKLVLPSGITEIYQRAFYECGTITDVTVPDSVVVIGARAFYNAVGLTSITIGSGVATIGSSAFENCYKLVEICNKSNLAITKGSRNNGEAGYYAKNIYTPNGGCSKLTVEDGYVLYTDGEDKILVGYNGAETELTLPNGITAINKYAFYNCGKITGITFADTAVWYRTDDNADWQNKTGGTETSVADPSTNANYFTANYYGSYWYK